MNEHSKVNANPSPLEAMALRFGEVIKDFYSSDYTHQLINKSLEPYQIKYSRRPNVLRASQTLQPCPGRDQHNDPYNTQLRFLDRTFVPSRTYREIGYTIHESHQSRATKRSIESQNASSQFALSQEMIMYKETQLATPWPPNAPNWSAQPPSLIPRPVESHHRVSTDYSNSDAFSTPSTDPNSITPILLDHAHRNTDGRSRTSEPMRPSTRHSEWISKPPFSYITLIVSAMNSKPSKKITLSEIYNWIISSFAFYRKNTRRWQNSIRHALSYNDCFIKVPRPSGEAGKGCYWTVHPRAIDMFENGSSMRRNRKFIDETRIRRGRKRTHCALKRSDFSAKRILCEQQSQINRTNLMSANAQYPRGSRTHDPGQRELDQWFIPNRAKETSRKRMQEIGDPAWLSSSWKEQVPRRQPSSVPDQMWESFQRGEITSDQCFRPGDHLSSLVSAQADDVYNVQWSPSVISTHGTQIR